MISYSSLFTWSMNRLQFNTHTCFLLAFGFNVRCCIVFAQERECNTIACPPIDCLPSAWSAPGPCSRKCGGGWALQSRSVVRHAVNGGQPCRWLHRNVSCNAFACPVHCVVSKWAKWGDCSKACEGGIQTRTRTVIRPSANAGNPCPELLTDARECNLIPCTGNRDCQVRSRLVLFCFVLPQKRLNGKCKRHPQCRSRDWPAPHAYGASYEILCCHKQRSAGRQSASQNG